MEPPGEDKLDAVCAKPVFAPPNAGGWPAPSEEGRGEEQVDERLRLARSSSGRRGRRLTRSLGLW